MSDHFYLTLPSDASATYYPDNTIARYIVKLPERIRLDGNYEVGLSEIVYSHSWYNFDNRDERYWIGAFNLVTDEISAMTIVKSGFYEDGKVFAAALTQQATRAFAAIPNVSFKLTFIAHVGRMRMQVRNSDGISVIISPDLLEILGFRRMLRFASDVDRVGFAPFDVNRGLNLVYIYCDVASYSTVGDIRAPLLRVCNVSGKNGRVVRITYDRPHYVPVGRREFDAVGIAINNELGEPMPFEFGKTIVTLHFRRR
jgi:hypothetical protein